MLYVVTRLRRLITNSHFSLGSARFSSTAAALQCLALLTNIGHLPGIYGVEKGVTRFLFSKNLDEPLRLLFDAARQDLRNRGDRARVRYCGQVSQAANALLNEKNYLGLSRLLGIFKLVTNFDARSEVPDWMLRDFYIPFFLPKLRKPDARWFELDEYFDSARRLAYLNQDTTLVASPITVALSPLLSNLVDPDGLTRDTLVQSREILAAYEHTVYERFYHALEARKIAALVARRTLIRLESESDPVKTILSWLYEHNLGLVAQSKKLRKDIRQANLVGSISLRSFLPGLPMQISEAEDNLKDLLASPSRSVPNLAVGVQSYVPPDSQHSIEPDHVYIDAFVLGKMRANHVGRLIRWVADKLDTVGGDPADDILWMAKPEIARNYENLLRRIVEVAWPDIHIELKPWPLSRLGKFASRSEQRDDICVWFASSDMGDEFTKHVLRRKSDVPRGYTSIRDELYGLSQLRAELRRTWRNNRSPPRKRFFLITASIRLSKHIEETKIEREFDGGILQISAPTGVACLYLVETKGKRTSRAAANVLTGKLQALQLNDHVQRLKSHSAYANLSM